MLNVLYNDYFSESEINLELACEYAELDVRKALAAYSAICEKAELDLREAELNCIRESGDMDMLTSFYMEADEKTAEKSESIFKKIWTAIKNFFTKIKNFFTGNKAKVDPNEKAKVNKGIADFFRTGLDKIKNFFAAIGNNIKNMGWPKLVLAATGLVGLGIGVGKIVKSRKSDENIADDNEQETTELVEMQGSEVQQYEGKVNSLIDQAVDVAEKVAAEEGGDKNVVEIAGKIATAIGNAIKNRWAKLLSFFKGIANNVKGKVEEKKEENAKKKEEEAKRKAGVEGGKEAAKELLANGGVALDESVAFSGFYDDDFMFESSDDINDYDDEDIFAEAVSNDFDDIDDLLNDLGI